MRPMHDEVGDFREPNNGYQLGVQHLHLAVDFRIGTVSADSGCCEDVGAVWSARVGYLFVYQCQCLAERS